MNLENFLPPCLVILDAASRLAEEKRHAAVEPEHVVHALMQDEQGKLMVVLTQWEMEDLKHKIGQIAVITLDGERPLSQRLTDMLDAAEKLADNAKVAINHLAASAVKSFHAGGRFAAFSDPEAEITPEEKKAGLERQEREQREYIEAARREEALYYAGLTSAKNIALNFSFNADTGLQVVDLKIEAGPGSKPSIDGPKTVQADTARAIMRLVGKTLGAQDAPNPLEVDGDGHIVAEGILEDNIFT